MTITLLPNPLVPASPRHPKRCLGHLAKIRFYGWTPVGPIIKVTGDVDADGKSEIWTILLEKAYADMLGGYENIEGNYPGSMYTALTGATNNPPVITAGNAPPYTSTMTDAQIWAGWPRHRLGCLGDEGTRGIERRACPS